MFIKGKWDIKIFRDRFKNVLLILNFISINKINNVGVEIY